MDSFSFLNQGLMQFGNKFRMEIMVADRVMVIIPGFHPSPYQRGNDGGVFAGNGPLY